MKARGRIMIIVLINSVMLLSGIATTCAFSRIGKAQLSRDNPPSFLKPGTTRLAEVVQKLGEPFGYRQSGDRSLLRYKQITTRVIFLSGSRKEYRMDLVFEKGILKTILVQQEGWNWPLLLWVRPRSSFRVHEGKRFAREFAPHTIHVEMIYRNPVNRTEKKVTI